MAHITRTDTHRPSAINPAEYSYVAESYVGGLNFKLVAEHKARVEAHMLKTGGQYSQHAHGGNCMVCGSVNAWYTSLFYHAPTNSYVRVGHDCADKIDMGGSFDRKAFRKAGDDARKYATGTRKAEAVLTDKGLSQAWVIFKGDNTAYKSEEMTVVSMVSNLVKYGSFASDKQANYLSILLKRINSREVKQAQFAAERETAKPVPTGRITVTGEVIKIDTQSNQWGTRDVMTVKSSDGWLVWGTMPAAFTGKRGDTVSFVATVEASDRDPKFGFFKRPVLAQAAAK